MLETPVGFLGQKDPLAKGQAIHYSILGRPCGSAGKESTRNVGDWVLSLDWEDLLEEGKATRSSSLAWVTKSQTQLSDFHSEAQKYFVTKNMGSLKTEFRQRNEEI